MKADLILDIMKSKQITKAEMARRIGTTPVNITQILRPDKDIDYSSLLKMSKALGYSVEIVLKER